MSNNEAQQGVLGRYLELYSRDRFARLYREVAVGLGSELRIDHIVDAGKGGSPDEFCACGNYGLRWCFRTRPAAGRLPADLPAVPGKPGWFAVGQAEVDGRALKPDGTLQIGSTCIQTVMGVSAEEARMLIKAGGELQSSVDNLAKTQKAAGTFAQWLEQNPVPAWLAQPGLTLEPKKAQLAADFVAAALPLPEPLLKDVRGAYDQARDASLAAPNGPEQGFLRAYRDAGLLSKPLALALYLLEQGKPIGGLVKVIGYAKGDLGEGAELKGNAALIRADQRLLDVVADLPAPAALGEPVAKNLLEKCRVRLRGDSREGEPYGWFQHPLWETQREALFGLLARNRDAVAALEEQGDMRVEAVRGYWLEWHPPAAA